MADRTLLEILRDFVTGRKRAYCRVFDMESRDVQMVVGDLARFCRANESTHHPDPYVAARLDGRREAWLRIQQNLNLDAEALLRPYNPER